MPGYHVIGRKVERLTPDAPDYARLVDQAHRLGLPVDAVVVEMTTTTMVAEDSEGAPLAVIVDRSGSVRSAPTTAPRRGRRSRPTAKPRLSLDEQIVRDAIAAAANDSDDDEAA